MKCEVLLACLSLVLGTVFANYPDTPETPTTEENVQSIETQPSVTAEDYSSYPGHLRPLGFGAMQLPVPTYTGFPKAQAFINEYVSVGAPVVFQRAAMWMGKAFGDWSEDRWARSGAGLTTLVEVSHGGIKDTMSLRNFSKKITQLEEVAIEGPVPDVLLKQLLVPRALLCDPLTKEFLDVLMRFNVGEENSKLRSNAHDVLLCQVGGARRLTLVNPITVTNKAAILDQADGETSGVDVNKVDLTKYSALADAEISVAHLKPTDCVYIPAKWLYHSRIYERDVSFALVWKHLPLVPAPDFCGPVRKTANITLADLPLFNRPAVDNTTVVDFTYLHYFVDNCLEAEKPVTPVEFEASLIQLATAMGIALTADLQSKTVADQLFITLDINKDGVLSNEDLDTADLESLAAITAGLTESVRQLQVLQKPIAPEVPVAGSVPLDSLDAGSKLLIEKYGADLKQVLKESLQEILVEAGEGTEELAAEPEELQAEEEIVEPEIVKEKYVKQSAKSNKHKGKKQHKDAKAENVEAAAESTQEESVQADEPVAEEAQDTKEQGAKQGAKNGKHGAKYGAKDKASKHAGKEQQSKSGKNKKQSHQKLETAKDSVAAEGQQAEEQVQAEQEQVHSKQSSKQYQSKQQKNNKYNKQGKDAKSNKQSGKNKQHGKSKKGKEQYRSGKGSKSEL